jgi:hypothetical protein
MRIRPRSYQNLLFLLLFVVLAPTLNVFAQGSFGVGTTPSHHQFGVGAGLEPELVMSLGYAYRFGELTTGLQVQIGAGVAVPPYRLGNGSGRISGLVAIDWQPSTQHSASRWGGRLALLPYYARNQNEAGTMDGLGLELRLMPLHRGNRWTNGVDLGWQGTLLTHIRHSNRVWNTFQERYPGVANSNFPGPIDGWYGATVQRFRLGYSVGRRLGQYVNWQFSAGSLVSLQQQGILLSFAHGQIPLYLETDFVVGW